MWLAGLPQNVFMLEGMNKMVVPCPPPLQFHGQKHTILTAESYSQQWWEKNILQTILERIGQAVRHSHLYLPTPCQDYLGVWRPVYLCTKLTGAGEQPIAESGLC